MLCRSEMQMQSRKLTVVWHKSQAWTESCKLGIYHTWRSECFVLYLSNQSHQVSSCAFHPKGIALVEQLVSHALPAPLTEMETVTFLIPFFFPLSWPGWRKETQERGFLPNSVLIAQGWFVSSLLMVFVKTIHWRGVLRIVMDENIYIQHQNLIQGLGCLPWLSEYSY